ncbi:hypothetical protein KQX54_001760 [Cotesia glomerata]|uniref:Uncharacterized protein n=1 Tax=Cotesia glomerata TaxID=32391 RepID=A0AAV7IRL0_COTGL|nr:hypothetical protein KQX54_001760 [Cotesia glomerata]
MEVIELFDRLNESLDTSFPWKWLTPLLERYEISSRVIIISLTSLLGILFLILFLVILRKWKNKRNFSPEVKEFVGAQREEP